MSSIDISSSSSSSWGADLYSSCFFAFGTRTSSPALSIFTIDIVFARFCSHEEGRYTGHSMSELSNYSSYGRITMRFSWVRRRQPPDDVVGVLPSSAIIMVGLCSTEQPTEVPGNRGGSTIFFIALSTVLFFCSCCLLICCCCFVVLLPQMACSSRMRII